jgi:GT2 family glycosyltransferase
MKPATSTIARASVVIATLRAPDTLGAQLDALIAQEAPFAFEVVVSDNGNTETTRDIVRARADGPVTVRLVDSSSTRGAPFARNAGGAVARGDLLLFCDDDDIVAPGWIAALGRALDSNPIVGGAIEVETLNRPDAVAWRGGGAMNELLPRGFLPAGIGANLGIWKSAFEAVGGFDVDYTYGGGEDLDLFWRANLAGYTTGFAPDAVVHYRYRSDLRSAAWQAYNYGRVMTKLYKRYRSHGMTTRPWSLILKQAAWLVLHAPDCFRGSARRGRWVWVAATSAGHVAGSIQNRVLYV